MLRGIKRLDIDVESYSTVSAGVETPQGVVDKEITFQHSQLPKDLKDKANDVAKEIFNYFENISR